MTTDTSNPFIPGWLPSLRDYRDYTLASRMPEVLYRASPISIPSLTRNIPILDQGNLGSCTAYAAGRAFRYLDAKDDVSFDVSELFAYYNARVESGLPTNQDVGAYNRGAASGLARYGMANETSWPYNIARFAEPPPSQAYQYASNHKAIEYISVPNDIETMKSVLAAGFPIVIGFTVYSNYQQGLSTGIWPEAGGSVIGGHAVCVDGYEPNWWLFPNSWGASVGQQGWFKMSWNFLRNNGDDFWTYRKVTADVVTPPEPGPGPSPTPPPYYVSRHETSILSDGQIWDSDWVAVKPPGR